MTPTVTQDQVVEAANGLGQPEFSRDDVAEKLGVQVTDLKDAFKAARQAGDFEKVGEDADGKGRFRTKSA
jgi:hypothetical protein